MGMLVRKMPLMAQSRTWARQIGCRGLQCELWVRNGDSMAVGVRRVGAL